MVFKRVYIGMFLALNLCAETDRSLATILQQLISSFFTSSPASSTTFTVRSALTLNSQEKVFVQQRQTFIQKQLELHYGSSLKKVPKIAVCISGGGIRAMVAGLGFMQAMQENGLLDITTYICGLSGSTWAFGGWLESRKSVAEYLMFLKKGLATGLLSKVDTQQILKELLKKVSSKQVISVDDIWGCLIAQKALYNYGKKDLTQITLSNYRTLSSDGLLPMPIYNCVTPLEASDNQCYRWIEWTPFEVRCPFLKTAISVTSLGSSFENGKNNSSVPVQSLSFGFGTWGSAFSADVQDALKNLDYTASGYEQEIIDMIMKELASNTMLDNTSEMRPLSGHVPNWNYKLAGATCANTSDLTLVDCGFLCNLPLPPLLDPLRAVDIIIIVDASMGTGSQTELQCLQQYALANNLPFPVIDTKNLGAICSVHSAATGSNAPTFIYFPLVPNPAYKNGWDPNSASFTDTLNLRYTPQQVDLVSGLMYTACKQNLSTIWSVIDRYVH
jgi:phospholipase A2